MTTSHSAADDMKSAPETDNGPIARPMPRKGSRRVWVVDRIVESLTHGEIYKQIDYVHRREDYLKQFMFQPFKALTADIYRKLRPGLSPSTIKKRATEAILWEGDPRIHIHNVVVMGVQHRPDFVVDLKDDFDLRVAIEIKKGEAGSAIREGIGQGLVYAAAEQYDFVVYIFADTSKDGKIRRAVNVSEAHGSDLDARSRWLIQTLWEQYNIRFVVV